MEISRHEAFFAFRREVHPRCKPSGKSFTLNVEAICSTETSVLTRTTLRHHVPEDGVPIAPCSCASGQLLASRDLITVRSLLSPVALPYLAAIFHFR
jgi:hypothetical protein